MTDPRKRPPKPTRASDGLEADADDKTKRELLRQRRAKADDDERNGTLTDGETFFESLEPEPQHEDKPAWESFAEFGTADADFLQERSDVVDERYRKIQDMQAKVNEGLASGPGNRSMDQLRVEALLICMQRTQTITPENMTQQEREVALKIGRNILRELQLTDTEQAALMAHPVDSMITVSRLISIYRVLRTLLGEDQRCAEWLRKPNRAFDQQSALAVMLQADAGLETVQRYLLDELDKQSMILPAQTAQKP